MRCTLLAFLIVAACGGPQREPAPPPPPPDAAPALVMDEATARDTAAGLLEVLTTMAAIVEQRGEDCVGMAGELGALFDQAAPLVEIVEAAKGDPAASRRLAAAMKEHEEEAAPLQERILPGLLACKDEPALVEVMQRMPVF